MQTLIDLLQPDMKILFVGTNPAESSARIGHYFAGKTNVFWKLLYQSGLIDEQLTTEDDYKILEYGYGLTDVMKRPTSMTTKLKKEDSIGSTQRLSQIVEIYKPRIVAFVGKLGWRTFLNDPDKKLEYGIQMEKAKLNPKVFLLPSSSGASYADTDYEQKLMWYSELYKFAKKLKKQKAFWVWDD